MPVVLELGKILGGFFAAIVACALGPAAGCNSPSQSEPSASVGALLF